MTNSSWKKAVNGNFSNTADWTSGVPNDTTSEADLLVAGKAYTVTSSSDDTVDFLDMGSNATLAITGGVFTVYSTVDPWSNAYNLGAIGIGAGATMVFGQAGSPGNYSAEIFNDGMVNVSGAAATLEIAAPWFELNGSGGVNLSGGAAIVGATTGGGNTLDNETNTISGSGTIGNGSGASGGNGLILQNDERATIDATGGKGAALILNTGTNAVSNAGTIETTGKGGLTIDSLMYQNGKLIAAGKGALTINNAEVQGGGTVAAAKAGSQILLDSGTVNETTISTVAKSLILTQTATTDEIDGYVHNAGSIVVANGSTLKLNVALYNSGTLTVDAGTATPAPTQLEINGGGSEFLGTGKVILTNSADNSIIGDGSAVQFANMSTIEGSGTIGDKYLRLVNRVGGVVDADGSAGLTIVANTNGSSAYNAGLIEATGAGVLTIEGYGLPATPVAFNNAGAIDAAGKGALTLEDVTDNSGGGVVETTNAKASIILDNSDILAGAVSIAAGSSLSTSAATTNELETDTFNYGTIDVSTGTNLVAFGNWINSGSINLAGTLDVVGAGWLTLNGGGTVDLTNGTLESNASLGGSGVATLNNASNTIEGSGVIGDANTQLNNQAGGTIDATGADGLTINTGANYVYNAGVMQSDTAQGITIESDVNNFGELTANKGAIDAEGAVYGNGLAVINGTASIEFGAEADNDVIFGAKSQGTLILDNSNNAADPFNGSVSGFAAGDTIDLRDYAYNAVSMTVAPSSAFGALDCSLSISNGSGTNSVGLYLLGDYTSTFLTANHLAFAFSNDTHGGTDVTLAKT